MPPTQAFKGLEDIEEVTARVIVHIMTSGGYSVYYMKSHMLRTLVNDFKNGENKYGSGIGKYNFATSISATKDDRVLYLRLDSIVSIFY